MRLGSSLAVVILALAIAACGPPSAADLVRDIILVRNQFQVDLSSWLDRSDAAGQPYIYLDLRVVKNSADALDQLTVMAVQLDADGNGLREQRITLDVSGMTRGLAKTVNAELRPMEDGVEGIQIFVEQNPPEEVWDEFPEFARVRPRG